MLDGESIGARVSASRKLRGLTQRRLADIAHVSYSLLTKVEAGHATATPAFLTAVARGLRVDMSELTGQPYRGTTAREDRAHATIPEIRRALLAHGVPVDSDGDLVLRSLEELTAAVDHASALRQDTRYAELGEYVPGLIGDLALATQEYQGSQRERAWALLAEAYGAADAVAYKLGYNDLSTLAIERVGWAAERSADPLLVGAAQWLRAGSFLVTGGYHEARLLLTAAHDTLEPLLSHGTERAWSVFGSLHLKQAIVAARAGDAQRAWAHVEEAATAARRVGDNNHYQLAFGPANVGIHEVAVAVELGDGTDAIQRAHHVVLPAGLPAERSSHHFIDLARGYLWHGDRRGALNCLQQARALAPQHTRYHPLVRDTLQALARAERRSTQSLRGFAAWVGLPD